MSGDRRKRELFSLFHKEQQKARADLAGGGVPGGAGVGGCGAGAAGSGDSGGRGSGWGSGRGSGPVGRGRADSADVDGTDDHFHDVFRVMQELDMIAEDSSSTFQTSAQTGEPAAAPGEAAMSRDPDLQPGEAADASRSGMERSSRGGEKGSSARGRGYSRSGSVRYSRRKSGGGSSGFYRDAGQLGEDNWQSISASAPDFAPRLPSQWTSSKTQLSDSPPPLTTTAPALGTGPSQLSRSTGAGGAAAGSGDGSGAGGTGLGSNIGVSITGGAGSRSGLGGLGNSISGSFRMGRFRSLSTDRPGASEPHDDSGVEGAAAAAAASALLYRTGASSRSGLSILREASIRPLSGRAKELDRGGLESFSSMPPSSGHASRFSSFVSGDGSARAPRLQLNEHGVSIAERGGGGQ